MIKPFLEYGKDTDKNFIEYLGSSIVYDKDENVFAITLSLFNNYIIVGFERG